MKAAELWTTRRLVPEAAELIVVEDGVGTDNGEVLGLRLGDQDAVKGVAMRAGEQASTGGMSRGNGQRLKTLLDEDGVELRGEFDALRELANPDFRGYLPGRSGANEDDVGPGSNGRPRGGRKPGVIDEPPEQGVGVQQEPQRSLPVLEFLFRERLKELRTHGEFALQTAWLAVSFFPPQGLKADQRLVVTGDDDFFAFASLFDKAGKVGLGVMDFDGGHVS